MKSIWSPRYRLRTIFVYFVLGIAVLVILGPLFLVVLTAFKTEAEVAMGAFNFPGGLQVVPGLAWPIGIGPSGGTDYLFIYLSFEHPFRR